MIAVMDRIHLTRLLAIGRIGAGAAFLLAPKVAGRGWFGDAVDHPGTLVAIRALGIRDLVLGLGAYRALDVGGDAETWVTLGIVCDAVDATATATSIRHLPTATALATIAVASAAVATGLAGRAALVR